MDGNTPDPNEADRLLAATIYLMSCHARNGCPRLACMVSRHLELIGQHGGAGVLVRDTCKRLAAAWEVVRQHDTREAANEETPQGCMASLRRIVH